MIEVKQNEKKEYSHRRLILTSIFLLINLLILLFLFALYFEYGATPLIIFLILLFAFLTFFSPFLRKKKKSLYSRMFPDKKKAKYMQRRQKEFIRTRTEPKISQQKEIRAIDLKITPTGPTKQLIKKCNNCGMTLASFVRKCPKCRKNVLE